MTEAPPGSVDDRRLGALLGLAVGDALGTTYEFAEVAQPAYPALAAGPATDVVGGGPFDLAAGAVTDDTQMAACLAASLAATRGRLDVADVARRYIAWVEHAFDAGAQTSAALARVADGAEPHHAGAQIWRASGREAAGNGSLMRTAPIGVACGDDPIAAALDDSLITHADPRCALACAAFDAAIARAIVAPGTDLLAAARTALSIAARTLVAKLAAAPSADRDAVGDAKRALVDDLDRARSDDPGFDRSGFVRVAFRLAFWHAAHGTPWRDAVVDVASRGGDADTNAAIVGALLGARDGATAIPPAWRERVLAATLPGPPAWSAAHHPRVLVALLG